VKVPQNHGEPEPGHQGDSFLGRVDILGRELEGEPLEYHGDPDARLEHREVLPNAGPGPLGEGQQGVGVVGSGLGHAVLEPGRVELVGVMASDVLCPDAATRSVSRAGFPRAPLCCRAECLNRQLFV